MNHEGQLNDPKTQVHDRRKGDGDPEEVDLTKVHTLSSSYAESRQIENRRVLQGPQLIDPNKPSHDEIQEDIQAYLRNGGSVKQYDEEGNLICEMKLNKRI